MKFHLRYAVKQRLADMDTPVSLYLKLRDHFAETLLLEDSDKPAGKGISYICCGPIAGITVHKGRIKRIYPGGDSSVMDITGQTDVAAEIDAYLRCFTTNIKDLHFSADGLFGYLCYDAVRYFEQAAPGSLPGDPEQAIPDIRLNVYRYILVFNHAKSELFLLTNCCESEEAQELSFIERILSAGHTPYYNFKAGSEEVAGCTDEAFLAIAQEGINHCQRGDVFQIVLSRKFQVEFSGDEFNVYRALRAINPSQYLFYFDYGSYRLFGSSPEAQLKIKDGEAIVHPIAGTYKRTGIKEQDLLLAEALANDKKEDAEHVMLVDLARNDLSKNYRDIKVPVYKNIQFYSHVLHIVSEVTGALPIGEHGPARVLADTFPAGTLSGAPKCKAMQLIAKLENAARGFYGGCLGYMGFNGELNQAILIRSFLSKNNKLFYQAGAGIVAASRPESELAEINNKIAALRKAIETANDF